MNQLDDRKLTEGYWPPRSPDLTPPDFFLWSTLKVYRNKHGTLEDLKENIQREIVAIPPDMLADT